MLAAAPDLAAEEDSRTESAALSAEATLSVALPPPGAVGAELLGVVAVDPGVVAVDPGLAPFDSSIETKSPPAGVAEATAAEGAASAAGTEGFVEPPEGAADATLAVALRVGVGPTGAPAAPVGAATLDEAEPLGEAGAGAPSPAVELADSDPPAGAAASAA